MKICFLEVEATEQLFFETALSAHELVFASNPQESDPDAEIFCIYIHTRFSAGLIDQYRKLKLIATRSIGYDHIDLQECTSRGITVSNVRGLMRTALRSIPSL